MAAEQALHPIRYIGVGRPERKAFQVPEVQLGRVLALPWVISGNLLYHGQGSVVCRLPQVQARVVGSHLSSRPKQRLDLLGYRPIYQVGGEDLILGLLEGALIFLPEDERREGGALLLQEPLRYPGALTSRHLIALPSEPACPLLEEHASLSVGSGEHHQGASAYRQHRTHG